MARAIPESRRQIDSWGALLPLSRFGGDDESEAHFHRGKTQNLFRDAVNFEYFRSTRRRMLLRRIRPAIPVGVNCPPWRRPRCEILGRSCKSRAAALAGGPQVRYPGWMSSTTKPPANLLSVIPGEYVSAALRTLPDPSTAPGELVETTINVPGLGRVRFTCRKLSARKGKSTRGFWTAEHAVQVE